MPERAPVSTFVGGTNLLVSRQMSNERTINLFVETTRGGGKVASGFRAAEGIEPYATVAGSVDTSALLSQDGRAFSATGTVFAEILSGGTTITRGTIAYDGSKATIVSNGSAGQQVGVCSAGIFYVFDLLTSAFVQVADFQSNNVVVAMIEFMDGYVFALQRNSRRVYYCALEDMLTWDFTFGYLERSWGSDNVSFIKRSGRQLWFVGTLTSEVWADNGDADIPFAPIQGAFLDVGCIAPFSGCRDGETITWLSQDERGGGLVVRATGYDPKEESHYGVVSLIQQPENDLASAECFVHQITGHTFYWLYIPGMETTLVFDFGEQVWCERAMWNKAFAHWEPHVARCHCYAFEKNLVGVRTTGVIYEISPRFRRNIILE